jgi:tetratricopeptide (TPR) repeat protein
MPNEIKTAEKIMQTNPDSALHILQHLPPNRTFSDANRALYGILLFQALDKNDKPLQPDSAINFSVNYYQNTNDIQHLAVAYYYKALLYKRVQRFDQATLVYLKALDLIRNKNNFKLLGKIYSDMGDICSFQKDYVKSLHKYEESINYFKKAGDTLEASYKVIDIARMYRYMKDYNKARQYYKQSISQSADSFLHGLAYQEIGINYYFAKQNDSAKYFLTKSLLYPYKGTNYAIRCYNLADLYFDINQYDSALQYANKALKYPGTYFIQRECYRILTNSEYSRGDFKQMAVYMSKYQDYSDSVRKIETQTKTSVLEDLHQTSSTVSKSRQFLIVLGIVIFIITLVSLFIVFTLRNRSRKKQLQLEKTEEKLTEKQLFLKDSLIQKIEENRLKHSATYKKANLNERETINKEIFNLSLHLEDWGIFKTLMNNTFNNLVTELEVRSQEINHKEIIWCCLFLLDIPTNDLIILLDCQQRSLYKMKQRLTQKLHLNTTTELEQLLLNLSEDK